MATAREKERNSKFGDDFSMSQCSLMIRVDGKELEVPLNFGMTSDEIKRLYPYILQFANMPIKNPSVEFGNDDKHGKYAELSEKELEDLLERTNKQARYWYGKSEASLLDIAVRFALDIQLLGIQELMDIFMPISPLEKLQQQEVEQLSEEETEQFIQDTGLETEVDHEHDPGDEQDIPLGVAGELHVNLYDSGLAEEYLSDELDAIESKLDVEDKFAKMISDDLNDAGGEGYYGDIKNFHEDTVSAPLVQNGSASGSGLLSMYGDDTTSSIFDDMDGADSGSDLGDSTTDSVSVKVAMDDEDEDDLYDFDTEDFDEDDE